MVGVTWMLATGTVATVMTATPVLPSDEAVMRACPVAMAVTTPVVALTVATVARSVVHVTVRPLSTAPEASATRATSAAVSRTARVCAAGLTVTVATGTAETVMRDVADFPSLVAVMVAAPGAMARTIPADETLATAGALVVHETVRPGSTLPAESRTEAASVREAPASRVTVVGETITDAAATGRTATSAVPLAPPDVAVIVVLPTPTVVTRPILSTVATVALAERQAMGRAESSAPVASRSSAVSTADSPSCFVDVAGETVTSATARAETVTGTSADLPPLLTAICACPGATEVTSPVWVTVTTVGFETDQNTGRRSGVPAASRTRADRSRDSSVMSESEAGDASTRDTATLSDVAASPHDQRPRAATVHANGATTRRISGRRRRMRMTRIG